MSEANEMAPIEIKSGPLDVISSGTIITLKDNPTEIIFGPANARIKLILIFKDDQDGDQRIEGKNPDPMSLEFTFINFSNALGSFPIEPLAIGLIGGRPIYLNILIHNHKGQKAESFARKVIHYTLYQDVHNPAQKPEGHKNGT
jgi:hypothetical protein